MNEFNANQAANNPFGGAFNGQSGRLAIFEELERAFTFAGAVETGTYTGSTTEYLAKTKIPAIQSFESSRERATQAAVRLAAYRQVQVNNVDSVAGLTELAARNSFPKTNVFFYLDAHWEEKLPLAEEVRIILKHWKRSIVMVDDFEVPDDSGYGFDDYGPDRRLAESLINSLLPPKWQFLYPTMHSGQETGRRRGCVVFATDRFTCISLQNIPLLRAAFSA
ncbi:hypothetical protein [Anatilimnocola floriformis]|uniref:hypothetical protein n=1 Tax=Anatilimnocola floriformis TaxID=2948575 RepID=UPI0020C56A24|nr:hypothetical protein [Anatilimnocola floriformis]